MVLIRFYVDPNAERYDGRNGWLDPNGKYRSWYITYYDTLKKYAFATYFIGTFQHLPFSFKRNGEKCYGYWKDTSFLKNGWNDLGNRKNLEKACKHFIEVDKTLCWGIEQLSSPINGLKISSLLGL